MKKNFLPIILINLVLSSFLSAPIFAATIALSPSNIKVASGQIVNVVVKIDPQGKPIYTSKVELKFPQELVSFVSFTPSAGWMELRTPGYDLADNTSGVLIKTAGYPGGVSGPITFGTVSFAAKTSGNGNIRVTANSLIYDANNLNILQGVPAEVILTVQNQNQTPAPPAPPAIKTVKPAPLSGVVEQPVTVEANTQDNTSAVIVQENNEPQIIETSSQNQEENNPVEQQKNSAMASIGNALSLGTGKIWVGILVALVIIALIYLVILLFR